MIALLQRVSTASVHVAGSPVAQIDHGVLALIGVQPEDDASTAERLLTRILSYRIFPDAEERMNLNLVDTQGSLLLVPQFTLAADTRKGTRPGFSTAAHPAQANALFDHLCEQARRQHPATQWGRFGANMQVSLVNEGPVTFWLQTPS